MADYNELKAGATKHMEYHNNAVDTQIRQCGDKPCEYLTHHRIMSNYYRGYLNALIDLNRLN